MGTSTHGGTRYSGAHVSYTRRARMWYATCSAGVDPRPILHTVAKFYSVECYRK